MTSETLLAGSTSCWVCGAPAQLDPRLGVVGYVRCLSCGFVFQPERVSPSEEASRYTGQYFDEYPHPKGGVHDYDGNEPQRQLEARRRIEWIISSLGTNTRGDLLEVGAASGAFLSAAEAAGFAVTGVEPADVTAAKGRDKGLDLRTGTLGDIHESGATFDVVCAWHVLEHLPEPRTAAGQLLDLLRPGGWVFLELPNIGSRIADRDGARWQHLDATNHVAHYNVENVRRLFTDQGAEVVVVMTSSMRVYARANRLVKALLALREASRVGTLRLTDSRRHELLRVSLRSRPNEG